jgi:hypothetical protein
MESIMIQVFQVHTAATAPSLELAFPGADFAPVRFDGTPRAQVSIDRAVSGRVVSLRGGSKQFYSVGLGAFAIPEAAWIECEKMYYCCSMGSELIAVETPLGDFRVINPLGFLPKPDVNDAPCPIDRFYAPLFRITGRDPTDVCCVSGLGPQGDQFKSVYDRFGFTGLEFTEIWRDGGKVD